MEKVEKVEKEERDSLNTPKKSTWWKLIAVAVLLIGGLAMGIFVIPLLIAPSPAYETQCRISLVAEIDEIKVSPGIGDEANLVEEDAKAGIEKALSYPECAKSNVQATVKRVDVTKRIVVVTMVFSSGKQKELEVPYKIER